MIINKIGNIVLYMIINKIGETLHATSLFIFIDTTLSQYATDFMVTLGPTIGRS